MRFIIETTDDTIRAQIALQIQGCETLRDVRDSLQFESSPFAGNFIYLGGHHVAVHHTKQCDRIAVITGPK